MTNGAINPSANLSPFNVPSVNISAGLGLKAYTDNTASVLVAHFPYMEIAIILNGKYPCAIISS